MAPELEPYERMAELTTQMAQAARDNDWSSLCSLERALAELRQQVEAQPIHLLSEPLRARKRELIQRMLDDDREVRRHTEPWMASMRRMFASAGIERNLHRAYGNGH